MAMRSRLSRDDSDGVLHRMVMSVKLIAELGNLERLTDSLRRPYEEGKQKQLGDRLGPST